jgi:hypothetical protein
MKTLLIGAISLLIGLAGGFWIGFISQPKENYQQTFEADLTEAKCFLMTLRTLDSGDISKTRNIGILPILVDLSSLPSYAAKTHPSPEQKQEMVLIARDALDYMLQHRDEWDPRLPSVRMGIAGLGEILSDPADVQRLAELTNHLADIEKTMPPKS